MAGKPKLTNEQVEDMLCETYAGVYNSVEQVAEKYRVSECLIRQIFSRRAYISVLDNLKIPLQEIKLKIMKCKCDYDWHSQDEAEQILKDVMNRRYLSKYEIIRKYKLKDQWLHKLFHDSTHFYKLKKSLGFSNTVLREAYSLINLETVKLGDVYDSLDQRSDLLLSDLNNIFDRIYIKKDNLQDIANDFGFTKTHVQNIKMNKAWKNYPRPTCN